MGAICNEIASYLLLQLGKLAALEVAVRQERDRSQDALATFECNLSKSLADLAAKLEQLHEERACAMTRVDASLQQLSEEYRHLLLHEERRTVSLVAVDDLVCIVRSAPVVCTSSYACASALDANQIR